MGLRDFLIAVSRLEILGALEDLETWLTVRRLGGSTQRPWALRQLYARIARRIEAAVTGAASHCSTIESSTEVKFPLRCSMRPVAWA